MAVVGGILTGLQARVQLLPRGLLLQPPSKVAQAALKLPVQARPQRDDPAMQVMRRLRRLRRPVDRRKPRRLLVTRPSGPSPMATMKRQRLQQVRQLATPSRTERSQLQLLLQATLLKKSLVTSRMENVVVVTVVLEATRAKRAQVQVAAVPSLSAMALSRKALLPHCLQLSSMLVALAARQGRQGHVLKQQEQLARWLQMHWPAALVRLLQLGRAQLLATQCWGVPLWTKH